MSHLISSKLRSMVSNSARWWLRVRSLLSRLAKERDAFASGVYHMLSLTLGEPVKEFTYAFPSDKDGKQVGEVKKYTPKSFMGNRRQGPETVPS